MNLSLLTLRKKCPIRSYPGWHFPIFGKTEILRISPHSVRMQENVDQNNSEYGHFLRSVINPIIHGGG